MIPEMPGTIIAQKIKEIKPETKLIAMTAHVEDYTREDCIKSGFTEFILKPFPLDKSKDIIDITISGEKNRMDQQEILTILKYFDNDVEFMDKAFEIIVRSFPKNLEAMETAISEKDFKALSDKAHSLKNSLLFFGDCEALVAVKTVEASARKNEDANYHYPLNQIKRGFDELKEKVSLIKDIVINEKIPGLKKELIAQ